MLLSFWVLSLFVASCFGAGFEEVSDKDVMFVKAFHLLDALFHLTKEFSKKLKGKNSNLEYHLDDMIQFERKRRAAPLSVNPRVGILEDIEKDHVVAAMNGSRLTALKNVLATMLLTTNDKDLLANIVPDTVEARILELVLPHISTKRFCDAVEKHASFKPSAEKGKACAIIRNFAAINFLKFMHVLKKKLDGLPENIQRAFLQSPDQLMDDLTGDVKSSNQIRLLHRRWIGYLRISQKLKRSDPKKKKNTAMLLASKKQPLLRRAIRSDIFFHASLMLAVFIITLLKIQIHQY